MMTSPMVIGHRGAPGYRPEHTESSYRLACELGADAVEPDVVATSDGVLVVRHENEISGTTDVASHPAFADRKRTKTVDGVRLTGWFTEDFTWDELRTLRCTERLPRVRSANRRFDGTEPILRLRDVLRIADQESSRRGRYVDLVIEIKHAAYFRTLGYDLGALVRSELTVTGWADRLHRVTIECFELGVLRDLADLRAQGAKLVFLAEAKGTPADDLRGKSFRWYSTNRGLRYLRQHVDGISLDKRALLQRAAFGRVRVSSVVRRAHRKGLLVFTWTLRPENRYLHRRFTGRGGQTAHGQWAREFRLLMRSGLDGVFADHPDLAIAVRESITR
ncbi:glycerophosphodiester phosphodiesterase [Leucobacter sp. cx-328]|uniref:glycerophosphodiester phosphodiesterase family protein n=1 Tax=unclassified Leucobacter TaxID=2621730 RepID=UPI00165E835F|nr:MULTISPECIES: glycerophosphodiester phosphodiesterase family protein [unclassified Leucobacter]MBC9943291.1 glycerophosphodiester phosphodiesterase [Leucobacter sp. cx-328]